jgi:SAM-dependent methyltransferase
VSETRWERFAREDAEYYILTGLDTEREAGSLEAFFASGREQARAILDRCAPYLAGYELAIEIGCGVGRVALPVAQRFERVVGVDVSPTMLEKLADNAARAAVVVKPVLADEAWDEPSRADLVYSVLVFQHIETFSEIARYVGRIATALKANGVAYLQFDTRNRTLSYRLRNILPDAVLPRPWRRGIRRIRRSPQSVREVFRAAGLEIVEDLGAGTADHVFLLRPA